MEGLISKYNRGRKIAKGVVEYRRTGKTREEREPEKRPIEDDRDGFLNLYVLSKETEFKPEMPLVGSVVELFVNDPDSITYKLLNSNPVALCFLDLVEGRKILGEGYGLEVLSTQLASEGVTDDDLETVISCVSDNSVPGVFNVTELVSIISAAGFDGFVYSSPFDKKAFMMWGGALDLKPLAYSTDSGATWVDI